MRLLEKSELSFIYGGAHCLCSSYNFIGDRVNAGVNVASFGLLDVDWKHYETPYENINNANDCENHCCGHADNYRYWAMSNHAYAQWNVCNDKRDCVIL